MLFYKILASTIPGKQKKVIKNSKFKISATTSKNERQLMIINPQEDTYIKQKTG